MQIFISFLMMFLILILPMQVSAGFVAYRIAKTYIVVGMDSYSGFNPSDQTCRVAVSRDTHIFAYEEVDISAPQVRLVNIAKEVLNMNPDATTGMLLKAWITMAKLELKDLLTNNPVTNYQDKALKNNENGALTRVPLARGFVGEVKATGSRWSLGEIAKMGQVEAKSDDTLYLNQKPKNLFFSRGQHGNLIDRVFAEKGMKVADDMNSDATTMEQLIQYVIQHTPDPKTIGGVPIVVALQYGTGIHWFAGADQCPRQPT